MKLLSLPQILNMLYISTAKDTLAQEKYRAEKSVYHPKNVPYLKDQKQQHKVRQKSTCTTALFLLPVCNPEDMLRRQEVTMRDN